MSYIFALVKIEIQQNCAIYFKTLSVSKIEINKTKNFTFIQFNEHFREIWALRLSYNFQKENKTQKLLKCFHFEATKRNKKKEKKSKVSFEIQLQHQGNAN